MGLFIKGYVGVDGIARRIQDVFSFLEEKQIQINDVFVGVNGIARKIAKPVFKVFEPSYPNISNLYYLDGFTLGETEKKVFFCYNRKFYMMDDNEVMVELGTYKALTGDNDDPYDSIISGLKDKVVSYNMPWKSFFCISDDGVASKPSVTIDTTQFLLYGYSTTYSSYSGGSRIHASTYAINSTYYGQLRFLNNNLVQSYFSSLSGSCIRNNWGICSNESNDVIITEGPVNDSSGIGYSTYKNFYRISTGTKIGSGLCAFYKSLHSDINGVIDNDAKEYPYLTSIGPNVVSIGGETFGNRGYSSTNVSWYYDRNLTEHRLSSIGKKPPITFNDNKYLLHNDGSGIGYLFTQNMVVTKVSIPKTSTPFRDSYAMVGDKTWYFKPMTSNYNYKELKSLSVSVS